MAFDRAVRCPRRRPAVVVTTGYLLLHLYHGLPPQWDPLRRVAEVGRIAGHG